MVREIRLTRNKMAIVDDQDFDRLTRISWYAQPVGKKFYAMNRGNPRKKGSATSMHRLILEAPKGIEVDHINGDSLDNRRENLRLCTSRQNKRNRGMMPSNTSGFKGVYFQNNRKKWRAMIRTGNGKKTALGTFLTAQEAHQAYKEAAMKYHGDFAHL